MKKKGYRSYGRLESWLCWSSLAAVRPLPRQHSQWKPPRVVTKAASGSFGMGIARNKKVI
jgi:hypothetical protein